MLSAHAEIRFAGSLGGKEFSASLRLDVEGLGDGRGVIPLDIAKELLVRVAISLTNPEEFEELAQGLSAPPQPTARPRTLKAVK
jgi:hypothetical protein